MLDLPERHAAGTTQLAVSNLIGAIPAYQSALDDSQLASFCMFFSSEKRINGEQGHLNHRLSSVILDDTKEMSTMNTLVPTTFADRIQRLLQEREHHAQALAQIDDALQQIASLLDVHRKSAAPRATAAVAPAKTGRKRKTYDTTAEQSVLAFVKQAGQPTTRQIKQHWASEGRRGSADNELSRLVKNKKLKRTPILGQRGSRYSLP